MVTALTPESALEEIRAEQAWAVVRRGSEDTAWLLGGPLRIHESLTDIPLRQGPPETPFDSLLAVPFRQVRERGFVAHDDGAPLVSVDLRVQHEVAVDALVEALPQLEVEVVGEAGFETSDDAYADMVARIIKDEIGNGEGANLVVGRKFRAQLADWDAARALTVLRRLLVHERGAYWTFVFWTGERYLIGASPERHVSIHGGDVRMNPISGTFRLRDLAELSTQQRKARLLD